MFQRDRLFTLIVWSAALLVVLIFASFIGNIIYYGLKNFSFLYLWSNPINTGREGGIFPIIISTLLILLVCMTVAIPLSLCTAIFLTEFTSQENILARFIRRSIDVLSGVPSIVFGLFGNAFFSVKLGLGFSILSGGLTLACMVLPIMIRLTQEGLRAVPPEYSLSGSALGISRSQILLHLLLPAAAPSVIVGLVLGVGRALAETAALVFTSGYVDRLPQSLWDSGRALSVHIYDLSMNVPGGETSAYKSAFTLLILVFFINSITTQLTKLWLQKRIILQ
ncbi:MAG: phosphate ABC transporter permease PstA [Pseudomonadota bacterium]|nr:phosphate ABC transporter permease PstA [Pseudomonadota bacterium]